MGLMMPKTTATRTEVLSAQSDARFTAPMNWGRTGQPAGGVAVRHRATGSKAVGQPEVAVVRTGMDLEDGVRDVNTERLELPQN